MEEQQFQAQPEMKPKSSLAKIIVINTIIALIISAVVSFVISSMVFSQKFSDLEVLQKKLDAFSSKIKIN
jgi:mannitol-specific phosphotransferase system IIBC component